jgi:hypothetical protein
MIQAARLAPALRGLRAVTSPASSLRLRSGPVESGRAGRRCVRCSGPHETALRQPAPSPSFSPFRCAALRSRRRPPKLAPALRCARQGAGLASTAAKTTAVANAWCRAAGRRSRSRWSPCGSGRFAPCGPVRMAGRSRETARLGFVYSAARSPTHRPAEMPPRTPPASLHR